MPNEILDRAVWTGADNEPKTNDFGSDAHKDAVTKWVDATVAKVIAVIRAEAAIRYHEIDDEEHGALDLAGEYDPSSTKKLAHACPMRSRKRLSSSRLNPKSDCTTSTRAR